jgi:hypothetical protein
VKVVIFTLTVARFTLRKKLESALQWPLHGTQFQQFLEKQSARKGHHEDA